MPLIDAGSTAMHAKMILDISGCATVIASLFSGASMMLTATATESGLGKLSTNAYILCILTRVCVHPLQFLSYLLHDSTHSITEHMFIYCKPATSFHHACNRR